MYELINEFKEWFPSIARHVNTYHEGNKAELILELDDGCWMSYDAVTRTIRNLPSNPNELTEAEFRNEFGVRLSDLMWKRGISEMYLSELTGISRVSISNYITGKTTPSFYSVDKIAKTLNCSTEVFRYAI